MQMGTIQQSGYGISGMINFCEYLLVAQPGEDLHDKILDEQEYFSMHYLERTAIKMKPHIELAAFQAREEMEPTLIRWMHRILSQQQAFDFTLSNFSGFPPDTLYLRIPEPQAIQKLTAELVQLNDYVKTNDCPAIRINTKPTVSVAKKLTETNYQRAMLDFSHRSFHEIFEVKELLLLRRTHAFDSYKFINKFVLQPAS
ncbi:MAG: 2'-5' RNA ligase family protein [Bacteroidota bacterium]